MTNVKPVSRIIPAKDASDGAGVKIKRVTLTRNEKADPFLLLDEIHSNDENDFSAGFPEHPHRGFETLTYMLQGGITHEDSMGNRGEIKSGGAQWMSAGSGVIHSEMPTAENGGFHGFQIWINLPAKEKMKTPDYRDVSASEMPVLQADSTTLKVIAGEWQLAGQAAKGLLPNIASESHIADVALQPNSEFEHSVAKHHQLLVYVYEGEVSVNDKKITAQHMVTFGDEGDLVKLKTSKQNAGCYLLQGKPTREPIANYGPFVMNTNEEIEQAVKDYQNGTLVQS